MLGNRYAGCCCHDGGSGGHIEGLGSTPGSGGVEHGVRIDGGRNRCHMATHDLRSAGQFLRVKISHGQHGQNGRDLRLLNQACHHGLEQPPHAVAVEPFALEQCGKGRCWIKAV